MYMILPQALCVYIMLTQAVCVYDANSGTVCNDSDSAFV